MDAISLDDAIVRRLDTLENNQHIITKAHEELKASLDLVASDTADLVAFLRTVNNYFGAGKRAIISVVIFISGLGAVCAGIVGIYNLYHLVFHII